jgi:HEAT repeat protein
MKFKIIGILLIVLIPTIIYGLSPEVVPKNLDMKVSSNYVAYGSRIIEIHFEISSMKDWQKEANINILLKELKATAIENRIQAAYRLGEQEALSEVGVKGLLNSIKDKSPLVRTNVLWALGKSKVKTETVLKGLINALNDKNENVRINAITSLYQFGREARKAIPKLKLIIKEDNEDVVREVAQVVLRHIEKDGK